VRWLQEAPEGFATPDIEVDRGVLSVLVVGGASGHFEDSCGEFGGFVLLSLSDAAGGVAASYVDVVRRFLFVGVVG
jgi:hypothetical protein